MEVYPSEAIEMIPKPQLMYAIMATHFIKPSLYEGTWYRRGDAIKAHCLAIGRTWKQCLKNGDRCVRVMVEVSK